MSNALYFAASLPTLYFGDPPPFGQAMEFLIEFGMAATDALKMYLGPAHHRLQPLLLHLRVALSKQLPPLLAAGFLAAVRLGQFFSTFGQGLIQRCQQLSVPVLFRHQLGSPPGERFLLLPMVQKAQPAFSQGSKQRLGLGRLDLGHAQG